MGWWPDHLELLLVVLLVGALSNTYYKINEPNLMRKPAFLQLQNKSHRSAVQADLCGTMSEALKKGNLLSFHKCFQLFI